MTTTPRDTTALLLVAVATLGLALKGIFAKLALATGLTVGALVVLRLGLAWPLFWAGAALRGEGDPRRMSGRDWLHGLGAGLLFLVATLADFTAIDRIGAGPSRIVLFTFPMMVVAINAGLSRRWPRTRDLIAFGISYGGLLLVLAPGASEMPAGFWVGAVWSLIAAMSYAIYLVVGQRIMRRTGSARFTFVANTGAMMGVIVYGLFTLDADAFSVTSRAEAALWLAAIVGFSTVVPMFLLYEGIRRLGAGRVSLISLAGPAVTVGIAWAVLGETLSPLQIAGFGLVLAGVAVLEGLIRPPRRLRGARPVPVHCPGGTGGTGRGTTE